MATIAPATEKPEKKTDVPAKEHKVQRSRADDKFKIFCGTANEALTDEICAFLGMDRGKATVTRFSDGEVYIQIMENVRGSDVFVVQPTCFPVDEHLLELAHIGQNVDRLRERDDRVADELTRAMPGDLAAPVDLDDGGAVGRALGRSGSLAGRVHRRMLEQ